MSDIAAAREKRAKRKRRAVLVEEVVKYAKRDCTTCEGSGLVDEVPCECAEQRFQFLHMDLLVLREGVMWWK